MSLAQQALEYAERDGSKDLIGLSHARLSASLLRLDKYEEAEIHTKKALTVAIETEDHILHCMSLHNLAAVKQAQGNYQEVINF
jgi:tetratricopeptide (TPR) repeat protein